MILTAEQHDLESGPQHDAAGPQQLRAPDLA